MAYTRGKHYIWADSEDVFHFWSSDDSELYYPQRVEIPEAVVDEFVLMRLAELIAEGRIGETIERFLSEQGQNGNFGGGLLKEKAALLKQKLEEIQF